MGERERERERERDKRERIVVLSLPFADRGLFVGTAPQGETILHLISETSGKFQ